MTRHGVLFAAAAAAAAGCLSPGLGASDSVRFYQLSAQDPAPAPKEAAFGAPALAVSVPRARAGFETRLMAYSPRPGELLYYSVNEWVDSPARMLQAALVRYLEEKGAWGSVAAEPHPEAADYRLDVDDLLLVQEFFAKPSRVRMSLEMRLVKARSGRIVGTRRFEDVEDAPGNDPYSGVTAADRALDTILGQAARWLSDLSRRSISR
jgi:cholesterol transport system auxiliary component